jgi:hypothetical protein
MYPKAVIVRSKPYLRWVASLACAGCGIEGFSQAAHANYGKGMSMKTCDTRTFPLCAPHWGRPGCHQEHDLCFGMTRNDRRELEARYVAQTQAMAQEAGRKELKAA